MTDLDRAIEVLREVPSMISRAAILKRGMRNRIVERKPMRVDYSTALNAAREAMRSYRSYDHTSAHKCALELAGLLRAIDAQPIDKNRFETAPCYMCGYNGPGYYQPSQHPCAADYHAAKEDRLDL